MSSDSPVITNRAIDLASRTHVYMGTSSWKYQGWQGMVYNDHYPSKAAFERRCLNEYARHFPTVGVDATFYRFPSEKTIAGLDALTPDYFKVGFKVTEDITVFKYPTHPRYGNRKGLNNTNFLNADLFNRAFLAPVRRLEQKLGPIMFEFGALPKDMVEDGTFLARLDQFLGELTPGPHYAVEIRNRQLFDIEYFDILAKHGVAHVHTSWSWMPPLQEQLARGDSMTADHFVMRLLTPPQVPYQEAVENFSPYTKLQKPQQEARTALIDHLQNAMEKEFPGYIFINNRLEGASPLTIEQVLDQVITSLT